MENFFWGVVCVAAEIAVTGLVSKGLRWMDSTPIPQRKKKYQVNTSHKKTSQKTSTPTYQDSYWSRRSFTYRKLKQTSIYRKWRNEQLYCQFGKCGICGKPMERRHTQLAYIKSRYDYGANCSNNLVLVHPRCNENKDTRAGIRPSWIQENSHSKEFDEKAWEIIQAARQEYPDNVPDNFINPPQSIDKYDEAELDEAELDEAELDEAELDEAELDEAELDEAELDEAELSPVTSRSNPHELVLKESEMPATLRLNYSQKQPTPKIGDKQLENHAITPTNTQKHVLVQNTIIRPYSKREQKYLEEINHNLVNMRTDSKWADKDREAWMDATMDKKPCIGKDSFGWR